MGSEHILAFTDDNFEAEVLSSELPVLVDFWAEWCMPCLMIAPAIEELAEEFAGRVKVGKVDTDSSRGVAMNLGISAIPTIILFKGGQVANKFVGLQQKADLKAALENALAD